MHITHHSGIFSATIQYGQLVVFDVPARYAGRPGTVTAAESAGWGEQDWRQLAGARQRALQRRQRARGLSGARAHMSPTYAAQVLAQRDAARPAWTVERVRQSIAEGTAYTVYYGPTPVETWRLERVPGIGYVFACYPAGHAYPTAYSLTPPDRRGRIAA